MPRAGAVRHAAGEQSARVEPSASRQVNGRKRRSSRVANGSASQARRRPPNVLDVAGLRKLYGSKVAVRDLSLLAAPGEVVGLLGPNGAGKTTTISCVAGLLVPDSGSVRICDRDALKDGRAARAHLGVSTQRLAIYPALDVLTNLRFFAVLSGVEKGKLDRYVHETAELLHLGPLLKERVRNLSVGQQRLVHVATSFVGRPQVLLLDEPTAGLDVMARGIVLGAVREVVAAGAAVVYSSHYLPEVEDLCARVVILHRGETIAEGTVEELVSRQGGGQVEIALEDEVIVRPGANLRAALASIPARRRVLSARILRPSLEAVFISLTGEAMDDPQEVVR